MRPLTKVGAMQAVETLAALPFFPREEPARTMLADLLLRMCASAEQAQWLVRRVFDLWQKWEGPVELRAVFCSKFRPKDGIERDSDLYLDGVPSEIPARGQIAAPESLALPPGRAVTADPELDQAIARLAQEKRPPAVKKSDVEARLKLEQMGL